MKLRTLISGGLLFVALTAGAQWNHKILIRHPLRNKTDTIRVWYNTPNIRGFLLCGSIGNASTFARSPITRNLLEANQLGMVYIRTQQFSMSVFNPVRDSAFFWRVLDTVAQVSGKPAFRHGSWVVFGHSTDGLFAQNLAVWKPERTLGILHYKSGNLGNKVNMTAPWNTLEGIREIPFLAVSGRFEEFGPNGPFPGCSSPFPPSCYREAQWLAMRDTLMKLRARDFRVCHLVDHIGNASHSSWSDASGEMMARFAVKVANAQLPPGYPDQQPFILRRMEENEGALSDSSIAALIDQNSLPTSFPVEAEFPLYPSEEENYSYWHPDKEYAEAWVQFHHPLASYLPPVRPSSLQAVALAWDKNQVAWGNSSINELGYVIQRQTESGPFITVDSLLANTTQFTDTGLTGNTLYRYRVYAWNSDGVSGLSPVDSARTFLTSASKSIPALPRVYREGKDIRFSGFSESIQEIRWMDSLGKEVSRQKFRGNGIRVPDGLPAGTYRLHLLFENQKVQIHSLFLPSL